MSALPDLRDVRADLYAYFGHRRDALYDLLDAIASAGPRPSVAHLSLAPLHQRGWGSLYAALRHGELAWIIHENIYRNGLAADGGFRKPQSPLWVPKSVLEPI